MRLTSSTKQLVEQLTFKSKTNVKSVCAELAANLKAQGWTKQGSDLITPASSILKRKRGDAELTIFVNPENGGSKVQMHDRGPRLGRKVIPAGLSSFIPERVSFLACPQR